MRAFHKKQRAERFGAFTLIELLVVIAIIVVVASLLVSAIGSGRKRADQVRESNAARLLITAYLGAAANNDGELMVAYYEGGSEALTSDFKLPDGSALTSTELHRYPFRLIPYLKNQMEGTILAGRNSEQLRRKFTGSQYYYGVSLCPSFGINHYFVGGYKVDGVIQNEADTATRLGGVEKPSSLLVFATAFSEIDGERVEGRFGVEPPVYRTTLWDENLHVDARYDGKAICAFLDGSVRACTIDELRDMRLWSVNAANNDDRNYKVAVKGNSGVGGGGGRR